jgi:CspA family cold shock protein
MAIGTVKWFNISKGFGLIAPEQGGEDVFVDIAAVHAAGLRGLNQGERVSYEIRDARAQLRHITTFQATALRGVNEEQKLAYESDETQAPLPESALSWDEAYRLAMRQAEQTLAAMRARFSEYAKHHDPYDAGDAALSPPPETPEPDDQTVQAMAEVFIGILNRRGLIRIDPA